MFLPNTPQKDNRVFEIKNTIMNSEIQIKYFILLKMEGNSSLLRLLVPLKETSDPPHSLYGKYFIHII